MADDIAAFDANAASRSTEAIVLTGSSSFARWQTMEEDLAPLTVLPRGFGGSTMADVAPLCRPAGIALQAPRGGYLPG